MFPVTQSSTSAVPGKRFASNPDVYALLGIVFESRTADAVFTAPINPSCGGYGLITQFCQVGDQGVALIVQMTNQSNGLPFDISDSSARLIRVQYPDGSATEFVASLYTDGIDGKIVYVTSDDDLDQIGTCFIQGFATIGGEQIATEQTDFQVLGNIVIPEP